MKVGTKVVFRAPSASYHGTVIGSEGANEPVVRWDHKIIMGERVNMYAQVSVVDITRVNLESEEGV